jgi:hypothetical protein
MTATRILKRKGLDKYTTKERGIEPNVHRRPSPVTLRDLIGHLYTPVGEALSFQQHLAMPQSPSRPVIQCQVENALTSSLPLHDPASILHQLMLLLREIPTKILHR